MPPEHDNFDDSTREVRVLSVGSRVANYTILEHVGRGGMGEVYLADDTHLKRKVALKFLPAELISKQDARARFLREARAAAGLNHPNIVTVHEVGEWHGRPYIAMEYVEGKPLSQLVDSAPVSPDTVARLIIQVADGLAEAHSRGIVHRDIKCANILVDKRGNARVVDFGLAVVADDQNLTRSGTTVGTIKYMSPEQVRGQKIDHRSDLFSLGVVTYELLTGESPFKRSNSAATLSAILHDEPEPLDVKVPELPVALKEATNRMLCKDINNRFQSAEDLIFLLKNVVSDYDTKTKAFEYSAPMRRRLAGRGLIAAGVVVAILAVLFAFKPWTTELSSESVARAPADLLAVMYFDNLAESEDSKRLGEVCTNLLITSLSESDEIRVLSSERLFELMQKADASGSGSSAPTEIARTANASWMLTGTVLQSDPNLVLTAQLVDLSTGEVSFSQRSVGGDGQDIFSQLDDLSAQIMQEMGLSQQSARSLASMTTSSPEAYQHYVAGLDFIRRGFPFEAKAEFERALQEDSTMAMAYYWIVRHGLDTSRREELIQKALKYSDGLPEREKTMIAAQAEKTRGNLQQAADILEDAYFEDTTDYTLLDEYAEVLTVLPRTLDSVISIRKRQIALFPENFELYDWVAHLFGNTRRYDSALVYAEKLVDLAPDEPIAHDTFGETLMLNGKYEHAIESFRQSLKLAPAFHNTLFTIGRLYAHLGDFSRSDSCVLAHLRAGGPERRSEARYNLAYPQRYAGEFSRAIEIYDDGINADSLEGEPSRSWTYPWKFIGKAIALHNLGRTENALGPLKKAQEVSHEVSTRELVASLHHEAIYLAEMGKVEEAQSVVDSMEVLVGNRRSGLTYSFFQLAHAWVFYRMGNTEHAISDLEGPKNKLLRPVWEFYLAQVYIDVGRSEDAIPLLQSWIDRIETPYWQDPEMFVKSHYYLGRAYENLGEAERASEHFNRFIEEWGSSSDTIPLVKDARRRLARSS